MVQNRHVGIPFDIVYLGIFRHQVVDDAEHEVLHLGIAQVEHHLCAATSKHGIAFGGLDYPVGMLLVQLAGGIGHFGFYPDAELDTVLLGIAQQSLNTIGQFLLVYYPVAQARVVGLTRILVAKPSVVHHE